MGLVVAREAASAGDHGGGAKAVRQESKACVLESKPWCTCLAGMGSKAMWSLVERHRGLDFALDANDCLRLLGTSKACGELCPCAKTDDMLSTVDCLQLVGAAVCFSSTSRKTRLKALFEVFDFDRRGSLSFDEVFLLLDTCCAGIERFGGGRFIIPSAAELELVADILFAATPHERLSRAGFVNNSCRRARGWLQAFEQLTEQGGESMPFVFPRGQARAMAQSPAQRLLGEPKNVCGARQAFFMADGQLVRIVGPMLIASSVQPQNDGRENPRRIGWYHEGDIVAQAYSWTHDLIATACQQQVVIWTYPKLEPLAVVDTAFSTVALSWAGSHRELCVADERGTARVYSLVDVTSHKARCSNVTFAVPEQKDDAEQDSEYDIDSESSEEEDSLDSSGNDGDSEEDRRDSRRLISKTTRAKKMTRRFAQTKLEAVFQLPPGSIKALTHVEEDRILVCGRQGLAEILDVDGGEQRCVGFDRAPEVDFVSAAFHPRSKFAVLGADDGKLYVVEGYRATRAVQAFDDNDAVIALHACSRGFTTGSPKNGSLKLWSLNVQLVAEYDEVTQAPSLDTGAVSVCWSLEGSRIAVTTRACEVMLVHGVSGSVLGEGGVSCGHPGMERQFWLPESRLLTTGSDGTLRLWDMEGVGHLCSTCMVDRKVLVMTGRDVVKPKVMTLVALGHEDGLSIVARDDDAMVWRETFTVSEEGFAARLLAWSPCGQYLFAEDRVYDVWACEEFCRLPERVPIVKPQFWPAQGKGAWHVSFDADNAFEASRKSVLRKKGLRRIKLAVHAEEDAMGVDEPAPVHLVASEDDSGCFYSTALTEEEVILRSCTEEFTFALRGRDEAPKAFAFFKRHDADESEDKNSKEEGKKKDKSDGASEEEEEEEDDGDDEEKKEDAASRSTSRAEDLKMVTPELVHYDRTVQGCKGARGECIASIGDKGVVAYAALDTVVVAASRDGAARYLRMFAQVVCVRSCPVSEDASFWWLVACDTLCVSVWRINVSEGALASSGGCALWARIRLEGASEVDVSSSGTVAAVGGDHHVQVWRLQVDKKYSSGEGLFASSSPIARFPLVGTKSRISVLHVSGALVYVAELDVESGHIWVHETEGRKYRRRRATETSEVTCLWRDWCGDRSGSLWRVDGAQAKLFLLESKVHEGTGVALLRDGVSVSENGVVRLWTEKGVLENVVASEVIPGSIHGVCRGAIVVDGHRVISLRSTNVEIASAHKKILSLCRSRSGLWASIGEIDASVCLWTRKLSLVNEVNLDPKGPSKCTCVAFSQDSDLVAVGTDTGKVYIRSVSSKLCEDTKTLASGAAAAGPEASATAVQCLAWSPASTDSESFRLVVGLEDGTMVFYDHRFGQVRKPLAPRGAAWRWPPRQVEFADDCEIVRMLDADGKACFADSVSANPIPEETLDKVWIAPESVAGVDAHVSVLRRGFPEMSLEEKVEFASDAVGALQARGRRSVVGVTHSMPRQFNARGELLRVGGDGAVSLDAGSGRQRAVGAAVPDVVDACAFSADARLVALVCRGPGRVALVVDTVTGETRSGPQKLGERLVVESIAVSEGGNLAMLARRMEKERDCRGDNDDDEAEEEEDATGDDDFEAARGSLVAIFIEADTSVQFEHVILEDVRDRDEEVATRRGCSFLDERSFMCLGVASDLRVAVVLSAHEGALRVSRADTFLHELTVVSCGLAGDVGGHVHFLQEMEENLEFQELQQEQEQEQDSDAKKEDDGETSGAQVPHGYRGEICAHPGAAVSAVSRQKSSQVWASADSMCRVRVWRKRVCIADVRVAEAVSMPDLAVDGEGIRITTFAQRIELEDPDRPQPLPFLGHSKRCSCATVSWCGRFVFTAGRDLVIRRWDVSTAQVSASASLDGIVISMAYCGAHVYAITEDGVIQALDAEHLDLAHELKLPRASLKGVVSVPGTTSSVTLVDMDAQETFVLHTDSFNTVGPYPFPSQGAPKDICVQRALVRGTACIVLP